MEPAPPPLLPRITDYVAWQACHRPDVLALVLDDLTLDYAALADAIDALARALLAEGVRKGDRVASLYPPHPFFMIDFLAAASIGAIWVGLNPRYRLRELLHVVTDAEPVILFARARIGERDYGADLEELRRSCPSIRHVVVAEEDAVLPEGETRSAFLARGKAVTAGALQAAKDAGSDRDPCLIVYTSGSTGAPKGALLHSQGLALFAHHQNVVWPVRDYRAVNYFPINHVGSVADCALPCLVAGGTLHFMEQFEPAACLSLMARERITIWGSVPSTFPMILDLPEFGDADLSAVELIVWGGAAMAEGVIARLVRLCPRLATNYGMTEATSAITAIAPTRDIDVLANSVGLPFPGVDVRLVDRDGRPARAGEVGEIQARSAMNFLGYWKAGHEGQSFADDGWLKTGDLAVQRPDGRYRLVGRTREMFKSGGYNVYPREIEAALEAHPAVEAAAVVGIPDPVWQEVGAAFVVLRQRLTEAQIASWLAERLANYKIPKAIHILTALPLLPIGKVDKRALIEMARLATPAQSEEG
jgi:acyl-CoA synthetase (AMP-forming)/AMP-acid ligase II